MAFFDPKDGEGSAGYRKGFSTNRKKDDVEADFFRERNPRPSPKHEKDGDRAYDPKIKRSGSRSDHKQSGGRHSRFDNDPPYRPGNRPPGFQELDVWHLSKQFFRSLPSNERIEKVFNSQRQIQSNFYQQIQNMQNISAKSQNGEQKNIDWKQILLSFHQKSIEKNPNIPRYNLVLPPVDESNRSKRVNRFEFNYSNPKTNAFPRERISMDSESVFRRLLCALLPIVRENDGEEMATNSESDPARQMKENRSSPSSSHSLVPVIETHRYLSFSFIEKIGFELKSLGLDEESLKHNQKQNKTVAEIEEEQENGIDISEQERELDNIQNKLNTVKSQIIQNLPTYRAIQKEHQAKIDAFKSIKVNDKSDSSSQPRKKRKPV